MKSTCSSCTLCWRILLLAHYYQALYHFNT